MIFESLPKYPGPVDQDEFMYALDDLYGKYNNVINLSRNTYLCIDDRSEITIEYALFEWVGGEYTEDPDKTKDYYGVVFHGTGTGSSLREMRHTYFSNTDVPGYVFYLPLEETIKALVMLQNYFD